MARRKKTSPMEDWIEIVSMLPWWVGFSIAPIAYFVLHFYAERPLLPLHPSALADVFSGTLTKTLCSIGQYLIPAVSLIGGTISLFKSKKREAVYQKIKSAPSVSALNSISWRDFEILIGQWFKEQGYSVQENGGGGADGGIDIILKRDGEKFLVQCKQWRSYNVGVSVIREMYGLMMAHGAVGAFVVSSGEFTEDAKSFASGRNIQIVGGETLAVIMRGNNPLNLPEKHTAKACPVCGSSMVKRTAKKGMRAGEQFLGCSAYPSCRGTATL